MLNMLNKQKKEHLNSIPEANIALQKIDNIVENILSKKTHISDYSKSMKTAIIASIKAKFLKDYDINL